VARNFGGATNFITLAPGNLVGLDGGPLSIFAIVKWSSGDGAIIYTNPGGAGGDSTAVSLEVFGGTYYCQSNTSVMAASAADNWHLIGYNKANGSATPRGHKYVYDTATWTHSAGGGAQVDGTAVGSSDTLQIGRWGTGSQYFVGDMAVIGVFDFALSDDQAETLAFSLQAWYALGPRGLWVLDQADTTTSVLDLTGGGANQTALAGTAVSSLSVPVFSYGFDDPALSSSAAAAGATNAPAGNASFTFVAQSATTKISATGGGATLAIAAQNATGTVRATSGAATLTVAAQGATTRVSSTSGVASLGVAANNATVQVSVVASAGTAGISLAAQGSTAQVAASATTATLNMLAQSVSEQVGVTAGLASLTITAQQAAAINGVSVAATPATFTLVASGSTAKISSTAGVASFSLAAQTTAAGLISPSAGVATFSLSAQPASETLSLSAGVASFSLTAQSAGDAISSNAGVATFTLAAQSMTEAVAPHASVASWTMLAQNATAQTGSFGIGNAGVATLTFTAQDAGSKISTNISAATFTFSALPAGVTVGSGVNPTTALLTLTAHDVSAFVAASVLPATLSLSGENASATVGTSALAGTSLLGVTALGLTTGVATGVGFASLSFNAFNVTTVAIPIDSGVVTGGATMICGSWDPVWSCALPTGGPAVSGIAVQAATEVLYALSGRQFGLCTVTLRPCRRDCFGDVWPFVNWWQYGTYPQPALMGGTWYNLTCGSCSGGCSCTTLSEVLLPGPVFSVDEVRVDGAILTKNVDYRLDEFRRLVRLGGQQWPLCNDLNRTNTQLNTWSVTVQIGQAVPALGQMAVGELSMQFMKALLCNDDCALPMPVQSLVRQGVSITFLDPNQVFANGRTGLYLADLFITSVNPSGKTRPSRVYDVDGYPGNARLLGTG